MSERPSQIHRQAGFGRYYRPGGGLPKVMLGIFVIMLVLYALRFFMPQGFYEVILLVLAVLPDRIASSGTDNIVVIGWQLATLVTHIFMHANWDHILFNSISLLIFGLMMCSRLRAHQANGAIVFLGLFLSAGVFAAMVFMFANIGNQTLLVGASGAVSGLMGGASRFIFKRMEPWSEHPPSLLPLTDRRVIVVAVIYTLLNLSVFTPFGGIFFMTGSPGAIAWEAHLGGYFYGLLMMPWFDRLAGNRQLEA